MTFLNPAILWALAAVSIPIIIHIFNLKKTKKIEFSTLMFLKEIQQSKYKKIKLKQLLILLCRIAFIILLVMMFAKPFYRGYLGSGEKARSSVLIILDDSFSMQTRAANGSNFENAKAKITELLNILDPNDEVFFSTVSGINRLDKNMLYKNKSSLLDTLAKLKTSDATKSMNEVLYFSNEILKSAAHSYKEVYIFTDGQKSFVENSPLADNGLKPDEQTRLNFVMIGSREANNISIDTVNIITKIFEKNKPIRIKASLNNHNNFNAVNKSVSINFGSFRDEKTIDIPANSIVDVEFNLTAGVTGYAAGNIELSQNEISDDEISADNKQFFSFFIPKTVSLLMVSGSSSDLDYVNLALSSSEEVLKDSLGNRSKYYQVTLAADLSNQTLGNFDAVVIVNKQQFAQQETEKLKEHIENGGGVIVYPGKNTSPESLNALLTALELPPINGSYGNENTSYKFDKIDFEHPVFEGIFKPGSNQKNINIESPAVRTAYNLGTGENSIALVTLNNEKNFLMEYSKGKGKILVFAVPPDMSSSDYPAKNLFSPITVRTILYLANINSIKPAVTGRDYFVDLSEEISDSAKITIEPGSFGITVQNNSLLNLKNYTPASASYILKQNNSVLYEFSANFNKIESQTARLDNKDLAAFLKDKLKLEANVIRPQETITASILELRTGRDIWQYFLLAAFIFLAVEYWLARSLTKTQKTKKAAN